jgi:hypothetical protein
MGRCFDGYTNVQRRVENIKLGEQIALLLTLLVWTGRSWHGREWIVRRLEDIGATFL